MNGQSVPGHFIYPEMLGFFFLVFFKEINLNPITDS